MEGPRGIPGGHHHHLHHHRPDLGAGARHAPPGHVAPSPREQRDPVVGDVRRKIQLARDEVADLRHRQARLLSDLGRLGAARRGEMAAAAPSAPDAQPPPAAAPPSGPRLYAAAPVGAPVRDAVEPPPPLAAAVLVDNHYHVTNLGTILDVLA